MTYSNSFIQLSDLAWQLLVGQSGPAQKAILRDDRKFRVYWYCEVYSSFSRSCNMQWSIEERELGNRS